jgi:hypothetical protein
LQQTPTIFRHATKGPNASTPSGLDRGPDEGMAEDEEPEFRATVTY